MTNKFHYDLQNGGPEWVKKRMAELNVSGAAGVNKEKGRLIDEYDTHGTWDTPVFNEIKRIYKEKEDKNVYEWMSWTEFERLEGPMPNFTRSFHWDYTIQTITYKC